jgi:hypothetical protein
MHVADQHAIPAAAPGLFRRGTTSIDCPDILFLKLETTKSEDGHCQVHQVTSLLFRSPPFRLLMNG